jgi:hypothetical protein
MMLYCILLIKWSAYSWHSEFPVKFYVSLRPKSFWTPCSESVATWTPLGGGFLRHGNKRFEARKLGDFNGFHHKYPWFHGEVRVVLNIKRFLLGVAFFFLGINGNIAWNSRIWTNKTSGGYMIWRYLKHLGARSTIRLLELYFRKQNGKNCRDVDILWCQKRSY